MKRHRNWFCVGRVANRTDTKWQDTCGNILGQVVDNELILSTEEDSKPLTVNTNGVTMVVTCPKCGTSKVWYPTLDNIVVGAVHALKREIRN